MLFFFFFYDDSVRQIHRTVGPVEQLEWGCPNGTKYPPRQPIQTLQVMYQIG